MADRESVERAPDGKFKPGGPGGPGRPKGSQNRITKQVVDGIAEALRGQRGLPDPALVGDVDAYEASKIGPAAWFRQLAATDNRTFAMIVTKLIPAELKLEGGDSGVPLVITKSYVGKHLQTDEIDEAEVVEEPDG